MTSSYCYHIVVIEVVLLQYPFLEYLPWIWPDFTAIVWMATWVCWCCVWEIIYFAHNFLEQFLFCSLLSVSLFGINLCQKVSPHLLSNLLFDVIHFKLLLLLCLFPSHYLFDMFWLLLKWFEYDVWKVFGVLFRWTLSEAKKNCQNLNT